jgi:hypothetical protein
MLRVPQLSKPILFWHRTASEKSYRFSFAVTRIYLGTADCCVARELDETRAASTYGDIA